MSGIDVTRPNIHFFQYIQAYKPYADPVLHNTEQYQFILTGITYNSSSRKAQLKNFSFYDSLDESRTVYLV